MDVTVTNQQNFLAIDASTLAEAVERVLQEAEITSGEVNVAIVDDATIHALNRRHLSHDYPTDVLSFPFSQQAGHLEGELVVSADTARASAPDYGWTATDELLLYVIHWALHLAGYRDDSPAAARRMQAAEARHLAGWGRRQPPPGELSETRTFSETEEDR